MSNKILYGIVGVLIVAFIGLYLYGKNQAQAPTVETFNQNGQPVNSVQSDSKENITEHTETAPANTTASKNTNNDPTAKSVNNSQDTSQAHYSDESDIEGGDIQVQEVVYDGVTFTPNMLTIKVGDIVVFKNEGKDAFWPAAVSGYAQFDAGEAIAAGKTYQFKFTKAGTWAYSNKLKTTIKGTIKVTP